MKPVRRELQMVFQDPFTSLDPKWTVSRIVGEPLSAYGLGSRRSAPRAGELAARAGGSRSRAATAGGSPVSSPGGRPSAWRSPGRLVLEPKLILCDEPVSSLDVLVQAQVLNLLEKLRSELGLSYLFIAHDLALVKQVSDRVAVMYLGKLCEIGPVRDIYRQPLHPYTLALLASIPSADPSAGKRDARTVIRGELPSPLDPAQRLPVPHPLPPGPGAVRGRGAGAARPWRRRAPRGLPFPAFRRPGVAGGLPGRRVGSGRARDRQTLKPSARSCSRPSSVILSGPHGGSQTQLIRKSATSPSSAEAPGPRSRR